MIYKIEHKIETLIENAVMNNDKPASFTINDIEFSHWDFNYRDGWLQDSWIAQANIEAPNYHEAFGIFLLNLKKIVPRIALIGQCFIDFIAQPFLIINTDSDIAFFRYIENIGPVGLMFTEKGQKALNLLLDNKQITEEFYYYWNDAVNTLGYSSKLLLMFSAIESLVKTESGKKDWDKVDKILGEELSHELFGTKENPSTGLRHRLVHGEYFNPDDSQKDYLNLIHKKIINYFNNLIFKEKLLFEDIKHPQRHFFGNKEEGRYFIKAKDKGVDLNLKNVLDDFYKHGINDLEKYEYVFDKSLEKSY